MIAPKETLRHLPANVAAAVPAGVLATVTMDAAMVLASCCFSGAFTSDKIGPDMIGRWAGALARGRRRCLGGAGGADITDAPKQPGELVIGLAVHYLTGITLTVAYFDLLRRAGRRPDPATAMAYGLSTAALPLLIMYPSMGYGWCGLRSGDAARLLRIMLLGHAAFGAGIGLGTALPWGRAASQ